MRAPRLPQWLAAGLCVLVLVLGCEGPLSSTGGETHFLRVCTQDTECGGELSCVCGSCTQVCGELEDCLQLPLSECSVVALDGSCGGESTSVCEVRCATDADCAPLSSSHHCDQGRCRVGSAVGSSLMESSSPVEEVCAGSGLAGQQVLVIGDSFFATHEITTALESLAQGSGALASGDGYRDNSALLGNTLALMGEGITAQYTSGVEVAPVKVVLMTGGGADVLLGTCVDLAAGCPLLDEASAALRALLARMAQDGVEHVVYTFYPNPTDESLQAKVDALRPMLQSDCENSPVPCHWLDLRPVFDGNYGTYIRADGMNPTSAGSEAVAEAVWTLFEAECIAQ